MISDFHIFYHVSVFLMILNINIHMEKYFGFGIITLPSRNYNYIVIDISIFFLQLYTMLHLKDHGPSWKL